MNKGFSYYLSKYLKDYLILERNFSNNSIKSYKDTFKLLIDYLVNIKHINLININFNTITKDIILDFLNFLEINKHNSICTRNQRLKAIKSFYQYCLLSEIENINNIKQILTIKYKKTVNKIIDYLTEDELKKLLESIDTSTKIGRRNLMILSLLYDTAARKSEIINLKVSDINLLEKRVILTGKGNKQRIVPIMDNTQCLIKQYLLENQNISNFLIQNNKANKNFLTDIINKYKTSIPKNISPHTFRHSRAVHLLNAGVPLIYIRDLLGHSSIQTTEIYAKVLEKNKFEAIEKANPKDINNTLPNWNDDQDLLNQLLNF